MDGHDRIRLSSYSNQFQPHPSQSIQVRFRFFLFSDRFMLIWGVCLLARSEALTQP